jgi:WD40 repeat protein
LHSLAFSADGLTIASGGSFSAEVLLWNAKSGKLIRRLKQNFSEGDNVVFRPKGNFVISSGENQNIMMWDTATGRLIWSIIPIDWKAETGAR